VKATPGRWLASGWEVFKHDPGNLVLIALVFVALSMVGNFVVAGPLLAGMFVALRRKIVEGRTELPDLFSGFTFFIDALLVYVISSVFELVGLVFCIVPVFVVLALYLFPYLFVVDRRLGFWEAMEASRKLATQDLMGYTLFVLALLGLNLFGLILAGVGLLVTIPVSVAAITVAYQERVGFSVRPLEHSGPVVIP